MDLISFQDYVISVDSKNAASKLNINDTQYEREKAAFELVLKLRHDHHLAVFNMIKNNSRMFNVFRMPNSSGHASCKAIVFFDSKEAAELFQAKLRIMEKNTKIEKQDILTHFALTKTSYFDFVDIRYKVKIINVTGSIYVSESDAQSKQIMTRDDVIAKLSARPYDAATSYPFAIDHDEFMTQCIDLLTAEKYIWSRNSGKSYRCTYYDNENQKRMQISVGNLVLIYGECNIVAAPIRKQRIDAKSPIIKIGHYSVYNV